MSQNSKRQKDLSQEELELHEVLDSISGSVTTATATPPSDNVTDNNNNNNNNINNNKNIRDVLAPLIFITIFRISALML